MLPFASSLPARLRPSLELLESRIAPAAALSIINGGKTANWTDVDGDLVSLVITKGVLTEALFDFQDTIGGGQLQSLNLAASQFAGTKVTITAKANELTGGDNAVNIGLLDATGITLGAVKINGDLAVIKAGAATLTAKTPKAVASLSVYSLGLLGDSVLNAPGALDSEISGRLGPVKVRGNVSGVLLNVTGGSLGAIDSISIGGSLAGSDTADTGRIVAAGNIGAVTIKGSLIGGTGQRTGAIESSGTIANLTIGGSIFGGRSDTPTNDSSGFIRAESNIGTISIKGGLFGGTQDNSGVISAGGNVTKIFVGSSVVGGDAGVNSGAILVGGKLGSLTVGGVIQGGGALQSGYIQVQGAVGTVKTLGLYGGEGSTSGYIAIQDTLGTLTVTGDVKGGAGANSGAVQVGGNAATISISGSIEGGTASNTGTIRVAGLLNSLTLKGNLLGGNLAAGALASIDGSGVLAAKTFKKITINGSIQTGVDYNNSPGLSLLNNATIRAQDQILSLKVNGDLLGNAETRVRITARGQEFVAPNAKVDLAIGQVAINGSYAYADILAGYNQTAAIESADANPNAQIGKVAIKGDWIASNLVAGANYNANFGNGSDTRATGVKNPDIVASIASVTVGGAFVGTGEITGDSYGIIAEQVVKLVRGTKTVALSTGAGNDNDPVSLRYRLGGTLDVGIFEFA